MKEIVRFFWTRWRRAMQMDATNKINGKTTHYWIQSEEWTSAYKDTLSKSKKSEFDKEWNKLEESLDAWNNATAKQFKNMKNPMEL